MSTTYLEINDEDRAEIARQITEGMTSGILDGETHRISWGLLAEKWCRICSGTGKVPSDEIDRDGNRRVGIDIIPCPACKAREAQDREE